MAQKDTLLFELGLDSSAFERAIDSVKRKSKKTWGDITKSTLAHGRALKDVAKIGGASMAQLVKERKAVEAATGKSIASLHEEAAEYRKTYDSYTANVKLLRKEQEDASGERRKEIKKEIGDIKRLQKISLDGFKQRQGGAKSGGSSAGGKGGGAGGVASAVGGMMKGVGGIAKALGPILGTFSKMAPLIQGLTTGLVGFVQLLIDAEANAKEMNKTMLQASGTGNYFSRNMSKGGAALADINTTMQDIRDQATDLSNIGWGINKEDHMAVLSTLAQEGVAVDNFGQQFEALGKSADTASAHAKSFGGAVQVAVAYSRQFGVSLTELTQFQAEIMTELGGGLADVEKQFAMMSRAAGESGIAQNKFFAIIRGVSADLSLYNSRIEDSVKILGQLGKVMSPRSAAKFMSTAMQGLKGMGRDERLKLNLMGGGKGGAQVTKDLKRKSGGLASEINGVNGGGGVKQEDILDASKTTADLLKNVPKEMQGKFREAILEMRGDQSMNKKGVFGSSMAMKNLGPGAALQAKKNALGLGNGNRKLSDMRGEVGTEKLADLLGINEEELANSVKFESAMDDQRAILKKGFAENDPKTLEALSKAGLKGDEIDKASYDDILDTLDKSTQDEMKNSKEIIDYNQKTSQYTSNINDKIGALVDFVMNQLYNVMNSIWDVILDLASIAGAGDKAERDKSKMEATINKTRNKEMMDIAANSKDANDFKSKVSESGGFKAMSGALHSDSTAQEKKLADEIADLTKKIDAPSTSAADAANKPALIAERDKKDKERKGLGVNKTVAEMAIDQQLSGGFSMNSEQGKTSRMQNLGKASFDAFGTNDDPNKLAGARKGVDQGKSIQVALAESGYSAEEQAKMMEKLALSLSPAQLAQAMTDYSKKSVATPGPAGTEASEAKNRAWNNASDAGPASSAATPGQAAAAGTPGQSAAAPGGAPTQAAAVAAAAKVEPPATAAQADSSLSTLDGIQTTLAHKGIKMDQSFMRDKFWVGGQSAVLEATREALFEYFMYSKMDQASVAQGLKDGKFSPKDFGKKSVDQATGTGKAPTIEGFASGGVIPTPRSPDSVFVAARPGETISPAGSGGAPNVSISINGPGGQELGAMMRAAAVNVIQEWQRRAKFS